MFPSFLITIFSISDCLGPHIIVITQRNLVGLINGEYIYRVVTTEIIPYALSIQHFSEAEVSRPIFINLLN